MAPTQIKWVVDDEHPTGHTVPLSPEEKADVKAHQKAVAAVEAERAKTHAEHARLVKKLASGKASDSEVQAALAKLLGG